MNPTGLNLLFLASSDRLENQEAFFAELGGQVLWYPSLEEALQSVLPFQPDIVLCDLDENPQVLNMPLEGVFPFAKWIGFSAQDSAKVAVEVLRNGFSDYLLKPLQPTELFQAVVTCQKQQKLHLELAVSHLHRLEKMKNQTYIDDLTGLYNARYLPLALEELIIEHQSLDRSFSVLFIDVDKFKSINDIHGHLVGSKFLGALGKTLKNALRSKDTLFRYGGDEFVVLLGQTAEERAFEVADRLRDKISNRVFVLDGVKVKATLSIGIACYPRHASTAQGLLKLADFAMYSAKRISRNKVEITAGSYSSF